MKINSFLISIAEFYLVFKENKKNFVNKICRFVDSEFMKTCHKHVINSQISGVIGVDPCLNFQIGADPFNPFTIEPKGKPSDEEFRPELNQNYQIQLKSVLKQKQEKMEE